MEDIKNKETENAEESGVFTRALSKPVEYEGKTYGSLSFDLNKLTLEDGTAAEKELADRGIYLIANELNSEYLKIIACKACNEPIGTDLLSKLTLKDGNKILRKVRSFLLAEEI